MCRRHELLSARTRPASCDAMDSLASAQAPRLPLSSPADLCGRPLLQAPQQKRLVEPSCRRSRPPRHALHLFPGHHRYRPHGAEGKYRASRYGAEPFAEGRPMGRIGPSYLQLPSDGMGVHVTSIELGGTHTARCTHSTNNFFPTGPIARGGTAKPCPCF